MNKSKPKLCLACSIGGHLSEMVELKPFYRQFEHFFVTERSNVTENLAKTETVLFLKLINRKMFVFPFIFIYNSFLSLRYLLKNKPDIIISTGALCAVPVCYLGKLMGKKVIFIESYAKVKTPTLSGRLVSKIADLFIVHWEDLLKFYPKAKFGGKPN